MEKIYTRSDKPKVELITHRFWVTNPSKPAEAFSHLDNNDFELNEL